MPSPWYTCLLLLTGIGATTCQETFTFRNDPLVEIVEGQVLPLTLLMFRSGPTDQSASVYFAAYDGTNKYSQLWRVEIQFDVGVSERIFPLAPNNNGIDQAHRIYVFRLEEPSAGYLLGTPSATVATFYDDDGLPRFNCNLGDVCQYGAQCNPTTGRCDCETASEPTAFSDCSLPISGISSLSCQGIECTEGGVCATTGTGNTRCVCQAGYLGSDCQQKKNYNVQCHNSGMCIGVDPPSGYHGNRYVLEGESSASCHLTDVSNAAANGDGIPITWTGSYICLEDVDSTCGNAVIVTEDDGTVTQYRQVVIRENFLRTRNDILFTAYCKYDSAGILYIGPADVGAGLEQPVNDSDYISVAKVYSVDVNTGMEVNLDSLVIGDEVCLAVVASSGFTAVRINDVVASDGVQSDPQTFEVLRDGCPVPDQPDVVRRLPYSPDANLRNSLYFCITAFSFDRTNTVDLTLQVSTCSGNTVPCAQYTCGKGASFGRKKRETTKYTKTLHARLRVFQRRPDTSTVDQRIGQTIPSECSDGSTVIAAMAVLTILACLLLLFTVYLVTRASRDSTRRKIVEQ